MEYMAALGKMSKKAWFCQKHTVDGGLHRGPKQSWNISHGPRRACSFGLTSHSNVSRATKKGKERQRHTGCRVQVWWLVEGHYKTSS